MNNIQSEKLRDAIRQPMRPSQRIVECPGYGTITNHKVKASQMSIVSGLCFQCEDERAEAMERIEEFKMSY